MCSSSVLFEPERDFLYLHMVIYLAITVHDISVRAHLKNILAYKLAPPVALIPNTTLSITHFVYNYTLHNCLAVHIPNI